MNDDFTAVDASAMAEGIAALRSSHTKLTSDLDTLESNLGSSLAEWTGGARETYTTAQTEWDKAADHMQNVVNKMGVTLDKITTQYADTERQLTGTWEAV